MNRLALQALHLDYDTCVTEELEPLFEKAATTGPLAGKGRTKSRGKGSKPAVFAARRVKADKYGQWEFASVLKGGPGRAALKAWGFHSLAQTFNAGVLLIDCRMWCKRGLWARMLAVARDNRQRQPRLIAAGRESDQSVFNVAAAQSTAFVGTEWNCRIELALGRALTLAARGRVSFPMFLRLGDCSLDVWKALRATANPAPPDIGTASDGVLPTTAPVPMREGMRACLNKSVARMRACRVVHSPTCIMSREHRCRGPPPPALLGARDGSACTFGRARRAVEQADSNRACVIQDLEALLRGPVTTNLKAARIVSAKRRADALQDDFWSWL